MCTAFHVDNQVTGEVPRGFRQADAGHSAGHGAAHAMVRLLTGVYAFNFLKLCFLSTCAHINRQLDMF